MMATSADLTVCVRHIPCKVLEPDILAAITSFGLDANRYEIYLPKRPGRQGRLNNFGYGFVTGHEQEDVDAFTRLFHGFQFENIGAEKRLHVEPRLVSRPCGPSRMRNGSQMASYDGTADMKMTNLNENNSHVSPSNFVSTEWSPSSQSFHPNGANGAASSAPTSVYQMSSSGSQDPWRSCRSSNFAHGDSAQSLGTTATYSNMDTHYRGQSASNAPSGAYRSYGSFAYGEFASSYNPPVSRGAYVSSRSNDFYVHDNRASAYCSLSASNGESYLLRSSAAMGLGAYEEGRANNFLAYSDPVAVLASPTDRYGENFGYDGFATSGGAFQEACPNDYRAHNADVATYTQGFQSLCYQQGSPNFSSSIGAGGPSCSAEFGSVAWSNTPRIGNRSLHGSSGPTNAVISPVSEDVREHGVVTAGRDTSAADIYNQQGSPPEANEIPTTRLLGFA
eukprot:TRINITY_DN2933_c0_g1_i1.p1 TRINITY_DN2933_c0_g1~~TRINITY_DN2933_c0_g1_i1.p1  ORF type:complete len:450 (+),score=35.42 TRINITY_DN2933_c0_g1_i1:45-1394(+)